MSANPSTDMILAAIVDGRTNLSGAWIADGIAAYRRPRDVAVQSVHPQIDDTTPAPPQKSPKRANKGQPSTASKSGGAVHPPNPSHPKAKKPYTKDALKKALRWLDKHPSDCLLTVDDLYDKLQRETRLNIGRSTIGEALKKRRPLDTLDAEG